MKKILLPLFLTLISWSSFAQQITITGTALDQNTLEPLIGVNVYEEAGNAGTVTDLNGFFTIDVDQLPATISLSYIGYQPLQVIVAENKFLDLRMDLGLKLDEVVVTALGLERSSKVLGYSVEQLKGNEINSIKAVNFIDNLSGKIAGVNISQGATGIGSTSKITIRGESSFTNNNPLFVVDGIPVNNNTILNFTNEAAAGFQEIDFGNGAMEINPDDIESLSVLKGPGAAALYGARASNGVILIKTKDGAKVSGNGISFNTTTYVDRAFQLPRFQNKYGQGNSGKFAFVDGLGGGINDNITYSYGPELDQGLLIAQFDSPVTMPDGRIVRGADVAVHGGLPITPTPFVSHPDNLKNFYETGFTTINNLAFDGGYDKGYFRISFTDLNNNSILPGVNLKRKTAAARLSFNPVERFKISTAINYVNAKSDNRPANGYGSENLNYSLVAWMGRQTNLESMKEYWQPGLENVQQYSFNYTYFDNPYLILLENRNSFNRDRVFGNISATYSFNDYLSLTLRSGMDYSTEQREFRRAFSSNRFKNGAFAEHLVAFREIDTDFLLNYSKGLGDFSFDLSAGGNRMDQQAGTTQTQALSLAQPSVFTLSNAASPLEIFSYQSAKRINSLYALAKIGFRDFLYLDVTGRNDWSSALATPFSTDNTSFFYPSASLSLVLSEVTELPAVISFAKLRGSWAQVGNDTDPFQTSSAFVARTPVYSQPTFSDQNSIPNTNLLPEQATSVELGADLRFFEDRLNLDVTYYNTLTENQILSLPIALSSGYDQRVTNGGAVRTKGLEALLMVTPVQKRGFRWDAGFNFSKNTAIVESLPDEAGTLTLAYNRVYDNVNQTVWFQVQEGGRIGDMWGTGYLKNEAGDFVINANGNFMVDNTLKKLGNYNPDFILGWSNQISFNNFGLSFVFDWHQGGELVSRTLALAGTAGQLIETENRPAEGIIAEGVVNVGTPESPVYQPNTTAISAESYYRQYYARDHEENNTYDASYLKLREVKLGYSFSKTKLDKTFLRGFSGLDISLIGRNLFAFSAMQHFDPEQLAVQGNTFISGVEDMSYASTRSIGLSLGIKL